MKRTAIVTHDVTMNMPGSFMFGETRFISGEQRNYRELNYVPMDRKIARNALGIPSNEFMLLVKDDLIDTDSTLYLLPSLLKQLPDHNRGWLVFLGGNMDMPDPALCQGMQKLDLFMESNACRWKWSFAGKKSDQFLKYYYSAANMVVLSLHVNTEKLCDLIKSMFSIPISATYARPV